MTRDGDDEARDDGQDLLPHARQLPRDDHARADERRVRRVPEEQSEDLAPIPLDAGRRCAVVLRRKDRIQVGQVADRFQVVETEPDRSAVGDSIVDVDGMVYGAAVGLGFNYLESISYMTNLYSIFAPENNGAVAAGIQWYGRQVLGLFFGHATYTAFIGAGVGIARQLPRMRQKILAIVAGFIVAIAGHFSWDAWATLFPIENTLFGLVEIHLRTLIMTGPFTAALIALLLFGIRYEGQNLLEQMRKEAASGYGAILPEEVAVLASPWPRLQQRLPALNRAGFRAYFKVSRLQTAQLDLAMERWHRERKEIDTPLEAEQQLRNRVIQLRHWVTA